MMVSEYSSSRPIMEIDQPSSPITIFVTSTNIGNGYSAIKTDHRKIVFCLGVWGAVQNCILLVESCTMKNT